MSGCPSEWGAGLKSLVEVCLLPVAKCLSRETLSLDSRSMRAWLVFRRLLKKIYACCQSDGDKAYSVNCDLLCTAQASVCILRLCIKYWFWEALGPGSISTTLLRKVELLKCSAVVSFLPE